MHIDAPKNKIARHFLGLLCDLELVICLPCILPMLEVVHILISFFKDDIFLLANSLTW